MKKIMALGAAGILSLAMGTTVFAADSLGGYSCAMIGHHRNHISYIDSLVYAKNYCDNYTASVDVLKSAGTYAAGYQGCNLSDQVCQNNGVCVQGCPGGYVDADGNGICDSCEAAGYHGYCDNFVDADGNGVCDNLHNGYYCGNVDGNGNNGNDGAGNGSGNGGNYGSDNGSGNSGNYGSGNGNSNSSGAGYGAGYGGGHHFGGHHGGGQGRGCRR